MGVLVDEVHESLGGAWDEPGISGRAGHAMRLAGTGLTERHDRDVLPREGGVSEWFEIVVERCVGDRSRMDAMEGEASILLFGAEEETVG